MGSPNFEKNDGVLELLKKSVDAKKLKELLYLIDECCAQHGFTVEDYRLLSLANHVDAMIGRSVSQEKLDAIDASLFDEVSDDSLSLAQLIVDRIGGLQDDEKYLLSIHFEVAKAEMV